MKLYNTLSRKIEDFKPLNNELVKVYSCGPTVYDYIHIGNLSSFIYADTLRRVLLATDHKVKHVMNFTDVDDKTITRSAQQYPEDEPMTALSNLTKHYSELFLADMEAMGNDIKSVNFVNATDSIAEMQKLIKDLYDKKFAYIAEDGVYFSIKAYKDSGKKYGQLADITVDSTSHARIRNDEYDKESAHDFALWKLQTGNEPAWEFELDGHRLIGRPGWHIECSAMSVHSLGQPFDIHTGGVDLIFPHHENEIAQSTATESNPTYAKYFVHNEHLLVDGRKMSKSLNNFFTLQDITEKGYEPLAFRLMVLQSHYRNQSNFTWDNLEAAQNRLKSWQTVSDLQWQGVNNNSLDQPDFTQAVASITALMSTDLASPPALAEVSRVMNLLEGKLLDKTKVSNFVAYLKLLDQLFGLNLTKGHDITQEQKELIVEREKAREEKDWDKSDQIRKTLEAQGIGLRDTQHGAIWFRL